VDDARALELFLGLFRHRSAHNTRGDPCGGPGLAWHDETTALARSASFDELATLVDDEIDLAVGAALIARDVHPTLDVDAQLR
jgi:hypothetical protein